jgi:putative DNA primase/helicase
MAGTSKWARPDRVTGAAARQNIPSAVDIFGEDRHRYDSPLAARLLRQLETGEAAPMLHAVTRNESTLVAEFCLRESANLRFDHARGLWLLFKGHHWRRDGDGAALRQLQAFLQCQLQAAVALPRQADREVLMNFLTKQLRAAQLPRLLTLAGHQVPIATDGRSWDMDRWLLGCSNGTLDLRSGDFRPGNPTDLITRCAGAPYDPQAECPRWRAFLSEVVADKDTRDFLHRAIGYCLTGDTSEQVFLQLQGSGANGKSTLIDTIAFVMGTYADALPFASLTRRRDHGGEMPASDLAKLPGVRLVTASETKENAALDESRLKAITGGDAITARPLYGQWLTFEPQFKLVLSANRLPRVADDSHAFWRRVRLVPFRNTFDGLARDNGLRDALRAEAAGILAWAVEGCRLWQAHGLGAATSDMAAEAADWRSTNDALADFLTSGLVRLVPQSRAGGAELFYAYQKWGDAERLPVGERLGHRAFGQAVRGKFLFVKPGGKVHYIGLEVTK